MSFPRYPKYKDSGVEWLGQVPEHWDVRRFQRCVHVAEGQVDPEDARFLTMPLIAPNHIEPGTGRLLGLESAEEQGAESGKYLCNAGDVVYSKIRPALRKVCIAPQDCLCSADMYPLRAHSGLSNSFLFWLILSEQFSSLAILESQRVAMPKINRDSLKEIGLVLPSVPEQTAIAAFLDRETAKIDALVAEQERLIELLKEKRQAVISHTVTKGLNPDAPMKDSGVEWLGEIPAHWNAQKASHIGSLFGSEPVAEESVVEQGNLPFVKVASLSVDSMEIASWDWYVDTTVSATAKTRSGFIVFPKRGAAIYGNKVNIVLREAIIDPNLMGWEIGSDASTKFMAYALKSRKLDQLADVSTVPQINNKHIAPEVFPVPPRAEQIAIAAFLDAETVKLGTLIAEAQRAIELLQERRTALISAAVTGQIDVRDVERRAA